MLSSKLTDLLKSFSSKDFKKFIQYVESPFFNRNPRLVTLAKLLRKAAPDFEDKMLEKEAVFAAMYGKEVPFNEQQVYDHISFLMRLLEDFLAYLEYEEDTVGQKRYLLKSLTDRSLKDHFKRTARKVDNFQGRRNIRDDSFYFDNYLIAKEANRFYSKQYKRGFDDSLIGIVENLDIFYLVSKLKYSCDMLNRKNILNVAYESQMMPEVQQYLQENPEYLKIPSINIYYQIYMMLVESENEVHYQNLVSLLDEHSETLKKEEALGLYGYAQNYCTKQINNGNTRYLKEIFRLYKDLLKKELLMFEGIFDHRVYKNIVTVALRLNQFEWTHDFIESYRAHITPTFRDTAYNFNMATYFYEQQKYHEALQALQKASLEDVFYHLSAKSMLLKIYYEMEEDDALESLIDSFKVYLKRNKYVSKYHYETHRNLLKFVRRANKLRQTHWMMSEEKYTESIKKLNTEIEATSNLTNISWLKAKVKELERSRVR